MRILSRGRACMQTQEAGFDPATNLDAVLSRDIRPVPGRETVIWRAVAPTATPGVARPGMSQEKLGSILFWRKNRMRLLILGAIGIAVGAAIALFWA